MSLPSGDLRLHQLEFTPKRFDIWAIDFPNGGDQNFEILIPIPNIEERKGPMTSIKIFHSEHDGNVIQNMTQNSTLDIVS